MLITTLAPSNVSSEMAVPCIIVRCTLQRELPTAAKEMENSVLFTELVRLFDMSTQMFRYSLRRLGGIFPRPYWYWPHEAIREMVRMLLISKNVDDSMVTRPSASGTGDSNTGRNRRILRFRFFTRKFWLFWESWWASASRMPSFKAAWRQNVFIKQFWDKL